MSDSYESLPQEQRIKLWQIIHERKAQDEKWGVQNHSDLYWLGILMEEVGEVAREVIEGSYKVSKELTQVAAVALAWLECRYRRQKE